MSDLVLSEDQQTATYGDLSLVAYPGDDGCSGCKLFAIRPPIDCAGSCLEVLRNDRRYIIWKEAEK